MSVFVDSKDQWLVWTPDGKYDCSSGAEHYVGWQVNNGAAAAAVFHGADYLPGRRNPGEVARLIRGIVWGMNRLQ